MVNNSLQSEFQSNPKVLLLRVFCRYDDQLSGRDIFAAVTRQIADSATDEEVLDYLRRFYETHRAQKTTPNTSDFVQLFRDLFPKFDLVIVSLDALDEAKDEAKEELLEAFSQVAAILFITSRPSADMFKDILESVHSMRLETVEMVKRDIHHYIRTKMTTIPRLKAIVGKHEDTLNTICNKLSEKCSGMSVGSYCLIRVSNTIFLPGSS